MKMAHSSPHAGMFTTVSRINSTERNDLLGMTVRVTGKISSHDYVKRQAKVRDVESKGKADMASELVADTSLVEPLPACQQIQFIGEMEHTTVRSGFILHARVARDVDGLDITMFTKALKLRDEYINSRDKPA